MMAGRAERLEIGELQAYALEDGHLVLPNNGEVVAVGREPGEAAELLAAAGLARDTIRLDIQPLMVKAGERVILVDAGAADAEYADAGRVVPSMALAGVQPSEVTDVFISHAHGDHVGGLVTAAGELAFPAATIAVKVSAFELGAQVLPVVKAVDTRGHTPGHSSHEIGSASDTLFYLGDVAHHHVISVQRPS